MASKITDGLASTTSMGAYSGERDRRFGHRDRASDERDCGVMLRDLILWPSCVSAVLPFLDVS
jgi:hypothetical protein